MVYPNHISNQVYFSLFQTNPGFFLYHCELPGGVAEWCGAFISQFYRWVGVGAFMQSAFPVMLYYLVTTLRWDGYKTLDKEGWYLLPVILLFFLQMQYAFLAGNAVQVVLWYASLWGYMRIGRKNIRLGVAVAGVYPVLSVAGALPSLVWVFTLLLYEARVNFDYRNGLAALLSWGACFFAWRYFFPLEGKEWYTFFPRVQEFRHSGLAWLLYLWFPATLLLLSGKKYGQVMFRFFSGMRGKVVVIVVLGLLFYWGKRELYHPRIENMLGLQQEAVRGHWEALLSEVKPQQQEAPAVIALTNLALAHTGELAERVLDFPQSGIAGLIPAGNNYLSTLCCSWVYDWLGVKNEALHWSVETTIAHGDNPPPFLVRQIAVLLMETGKETAAARFLKRLVSVPFYREWAREKLKQTARVEFQRKIRISEPFRDEGRQGDSDPGKEDFRIGTMGPFYDLFQLAERYPRNTRVRDYLLTGLLLEKDIPSFYAWFTKYYPPGYSGRLPRLYRQALLLAGFTKLDTEVHKKYRIAGEELSRFRSYLDRCHAFGNDKEAAARALQEDCGSTFWYYVHFR